MNKIEIDASMALGAGARQAGFIVQQLLHNKRRSCPMRCAKALSLPAPAIEEVPFDG
jgi:hypothetical protein